MPIAPVQIPTRTRGRWAATAAIRLSAWLAVWLPVPWLAERVVRAALWWYRVEAQYGGCWHSIRASQYLSVRVERRD